MSLSYSFIPATNKDGESLGEFVDFQSKSGESIVKDKAGVVVTDTETGEVKTRHWQLFNLVFTVKGKIKGTSQNVTISTNGKIGEDTPLIVTLTKLGWVNNLFETTLDDDGLEVSDLAGCEEDEDGLETAEAVDPFDDISLFLNGLKGKSFWFKVTRDDKGWFRIDPASIRPKS